LLKSSGSVMVTPDVAVVSRRLLSGEPSAYTPQSSRSGEA
jgi:hypothetical protein